MCRSRGAEQATPKATPPVRATAFVAFSATDWLVVVDWFGPGAEPWM